MAGSTDLSPLRAEANGPSSFSHQRGTTGAQGAPVDFRHPRNPHFPTPEMCERLERDAAAVLRRHPADADAVAAELCAVLGLKPQTVVMGNGTSELITWIDHLLVQESLAVPIPAPGRWTEQPLGTGKRVDMFPLQEDQGFALDPEAYTRFVRRRGSRVAVICTPNDPDGGHLSRTRVVELLDGLSDLDLIVVDESLADFVDAEAAPGVAGEAAIRPNVIVLRSLDRALGLPGARLGYLVANPALAGKIRSVLPRWNLNSCAESLVFLLREHLRDHRESLRALAEDRRSMSQRLATLPGVTVYPSQADFVMVRLPEGKDGRAISEHLLSAHNLLVRECGDKLGSSSDFLRLAVRPREDVQRLIDGLHACLFSVGNGRAAAAIGAGSSYQQAYAAPASAAKDPLTYSSYSSEPAVTPSAIAPAAYLSETTAPYPRDTASTAYTREPASTAYSRDTASASYSRDPAPASYTREAAASSYTRESASTSYSRDSASASYTRESAASSYGREAASTAYSRDSASDAYSRDSASASYSRDSAPISYTRESASSYTREAASTSYSRDSAASSSSRDAGSSGYARTPAPSSYPADAGSPSYTWPAAPSSYTLEPGPSSYSRDPSPSSYRPEAASSYQAEPASSHQWEGSSSYRREAPSGASRRPDDAYAAPAQTDPFVVGRDDPRHGRLDPLDTSARWRFDENTEPFDAVLGTWTDGPQRGRPAR
ncbi:aminotransferase class I/II-fold pyridoxal phosphate-dependent enzyme [Sphaerisporangium rhizosphaerae]|uniref:Aminotransferase class I/II-fold pyridoxal phosphate-dependent enzyme n=1 Tax=Sphaerisporangium rhizosphaerae TaxID=2269375 RepID=A0ABW2NVK7_9ACTN